MRKFIVVLFFYGAVILSNAHGETVDKSATPPSEAGKRGVNPALAANSNFSMTLYGQLAKENPGKNLFFSPYSMSSALSMTAEGARGETAAQMGKVLGFPEAVRNLGADAGTLPWNSALIHAGMSELNERFKTKPVPQTLRDKIVELRKELDASKKKSEALLAAQNMESFYPQRNKTQKLAEQLDTLLAQVDQYELRVANALWGEKTYPFQPAYMETLNKFYGTGTAVQADFAHNFEAIRNQINTWVADTTNQRIKDLIPQGALDASTRLVLCNAIYFKGDWSEPFAESATQQEDFFAGAKQKVRVAMMHIDGMTGAKYGAFKADGSLFPTPTRVSFENQPDPKTLYPANDGFLMAELPYKGKQLSMVLMVPQDAAGLEALEKNLTGTKFQAWVSKLEARNLNVHMPKFRQETNYPDMKATLQALGMIRAFADPRDPLTGAQFDGMCASQDPSLKLFISLVVHKAFVEVNEKGTEAAAATAVAMATMSMPMDAPFTPTFRADKPFLFAIRDVNSGTILFLGRVVNPAK